MPEETFQVDLRGLVDLLSNHLYRSPRVFVRELLQNAVDAITARRLLDPDAPGEVLLLPGGDDHTLSVRDTGVGLTEAEVGSFLATIGRTSKRDELRLPMSEFLGQFGIGLLACFLIADEVRVVTRSATGGGPVEWLGRSDGTYRTVPVADEHADLVPVGTTVHLRARPGCEEWVTEATVLDLTRTFGDLLEIPLTVRAAAGDVVANSRRVPWRDAGDAELAAYGTDLLGQPPFAAIPLTAAAAGVDGVAFVLPVAGSPSARPTSRVYLKRMLLGDSVEGLLPSWAFFVRAVVDAGALRPTASREELYDDEVLQGVRDTFGRQLRAWLVDLASSDRERLRAFMAIHHAAIKALAVHDDDLFAVMVPWLPFETSSGWCTLTELVETTSDVRVARTRDRFRQVAAVAAAQGIAVVNGGYSHDAELVARLPAIRPDIRVSELDPGDLMAAFANPPAEVAAAAAALLERSRHRLDPLGVDVELRSFAPDELTAIHLEGDDAAATRERERAMESASGLWAGVLDDVGAWSGDERPRLVLNAAAPLVQRLLALPVERAVAGVEVLYVQALLAAHRPLRPGDRRLLDGALLSLVDPGAPPSAGPS